MKALIKTLFSPILSLIALVLSSSFYTTFLSIRLTLEGFEETTIGYIHSAFYGGFLVGSIKVEKLIRRVGHIRSLALFASISTVAVLSQALYLNPIFLIIMRFISGFCVAALYVVIESWMLIHGSTKIRGKILAMYMFALYIAQAFSQLIVEMLDLTEAMPFLVAGLLSSLSVIPVALTKSNVMSVHSDIKVKLRELYRHAPLGLWGCIGAGLILSVIYSFVPVFAQTENIPVGYIMFTTIAGGFILQWPIGKLSDRFDRRKIMTLITICLLIPSSIIVLFEHTYWIVMSASFLFGGFCFTIYPLSIALTCDHLPAEHISEATGKLSLTYGVGAVLGPIAVSIFMDMLSPKGLYLYICIVAIILALLSLFYIKRRAAVPIASQSNYVPLNPRVTPLSSNLDPRGISRLFSRFRTTK